ncbi:MAG TPA: ankyrin repeat domain-containing protein [Arenimonas sp.]|uniref:ankyrin repeat domain-containing protein n=1 Tax=Arenimonas sp. TaxID=1872635 RepID=UPI002C52168A|nr:ankyrin repeat domain-containing protein [Arenimonas sp.]HMB56258.1 ankyrin repeat domain-containing protein [Arenimonas sp.]
MAESRSRWRPWAVLLLGLALAWSALLLAMPVLIALLLLLAQPLLVFGWSLLRESRDLARPKFPLFADLASIALLWLLAGGLLAAVAAWPLESLRESGELMPALGLSLSAGCVLLVLWRMWPSFVQAARQPQSFAALLSASGRGGEGESTRGLGIALAVFALLALGLCLAWPGVVPVIARLPLLIAYPLLSLAVHAFVHRPVALAPLPSRLPIKEDSVVRATENKSAPDPADADLPVDARLYAALRAGRADAALAALSEGGNAHALPGEGDRDQRSLPMLAALQGDLKLLRELIKRGVDLNLAHGGLTPLLAATRDSWHGRPEAVMTLLANGADPRAADHEGNTPLHHAARSTDPAVAALLLDAGAQVDTLNGEGFSALGIACNAGNWRLARYLIEHGAKPEPAGGQPALLAAVSGEDDPAGVQLLLRHKARVDARGLEQRTALMQACACGNADIVGVLLDAGADRNAHDAQGLTPLLEAARHGQLEAVQRLAQARPDAQARDAQQRNALVLASIAGAAPDVLRQLLALGVDPLQVDADGRRAMDYAIEGGRWPQVSVLDPDYALPANVAEGLAEGHFDKTPRELLREALRAQRFESAEAMLRLGAGPSPEALSALLLEFSEDEGLACFDWLCRHGASADLASDEHDSVLFHLLDRGGPAQAALWRLLERGQPVGGLGGLARFLDACLTGEYVSRGNEQLATALLERGADAFGARATLDPPLIAAVRLGWSRLAELLLLTGVDPNVRDARGQTAMHVAAALGRENALRLLLRFGGLPQARTPGGQTALGIALAAGRSDLSHWLEWRGWVLPGRALQPQDLPAAAIGGDVDAVARLLDLGLSVDAVDHQGCTALLRAAGGGHESIVQVLIERGANAGVSARTGATPLSAAISMRHLAVVDRLLQAGADTNQPLPGGVTPLMLSAALGLPEIAGRLLARGADVDAIDDQGLSALHCAALHAFTARERQRVLALFDLLLMADLPPDRANAAGQTPLLLLLGARAEAGAACDEDVLLTVLDRLLGEDVSLDQQDNRGLTALHMAAMHGLSRVVQRLLREGADRQRRDALGRTAHDLALLRGYIDIAAEFEPARGAPSLARFLREPR